VTTHPKRSSAKPRRPHRLPNGLSAGQARAAGVVLCAGARGVTEARSFLMLAGLIPDPLVSNNHLGATGCAPMIGKL